MVCCFQKLISYHGYFELLCKKFITYAENIFAIIEFKNEARWKKLVLFFGSILKMFSRGIRIRLTSASQKFWFTPNDKFCANSRSKISLWGILNARQAPTKEDELWSDAKTRKFKIGFSYSLWGSNICLWMKVELKTWRFYINFWKFSNFSIFVEFFLKNNLVFTSSMIWDP